MILTNKCGETIDISEFCLESSPCQHDVYIKEERRMYGDAIFEYLRDHGYEIPEHFQMYDKNTIKINNGKYKYIENTIYTINNLTKKLSKISSEKMDKQTELRNFLHDLVFKRYSKELLATHPHNKNGHYTKTSNYRWRKYEEENEENKYEEYYISEESMTCELCDISAGEKIDTRIEQHTTEVDFNKQLLTECLYLLYHHFDIDYSIIGESDSFFESKIKELIQNKQEYENWRDSILKIITN
jgi:hypothetical protein